MAIKLWNRGLARAKRSVGERKETSTNIIRSEMKVLALSYAQRFAMLWTVAYQARACIKQGYPTWVSGHCIKLASTCWDSGGRIGRMISPNSGHSGEEACLGCEHGLSALLLFYSLSRRTVIHRTKEAGFRFCAGCLRELSGFAAF